MRILIIGAGAIGTLMGAFLARSGQQVSLIGRSPFLEAVAQNGLRVENDTAKWQVRPAAVFPSVAAALTAGPYDIAMLSVKSYDTASVLEEMQATGVALPPLLSWQNGVGNEEMLAAALGPEKVLAGILTTPVISLAPGHIKVSRPSFHCGVAALHPATSPLLDKVVMALLLAGFTVQQIDDYRRLKWSKLLLNLPANAQSAILGWTPTQLYADPLAGRLEAQAWQEAFRVMAAAQIKPVVIGSYPLPWLAPLVRFTPPGLLRGVLGRFVVGGRGDKYPSFYLARRAGQKRSEVHWLNGAVAEMGKRVGVSAPVNRTFTAVLEALLRGQLADEQFAGQPAQLAAVVSRVRRGKPAILTGA